MTLGVRRSFSCTAAKGPLLRRLRVWSGWRPLLSDGKSQPLGEVRRAPRMGSRFGFSVEPTPADSGCGPDPVRIGRRKTWKLSTQLLRL